MPYERYTAQLGLKPKRKSENRCENCGRDYGREELCYECGCCDRCCRCWLDDRR